MSFWVIFFMAKTFPRSFIENGPKLRVLILEGGEGDAVGDQDDWEIIIATWADNSELDSRGFV